MNSVFDKIFRWLRCRKIVGHIPKESFVCDIGCGSQAYFLKKASKFINYGIGFDQKIEDRKEKNYELKNLTLFEKIPLGDQSCDAVVIMAVIEHLYNPKPIINESFRILKSGGKLILTSPTPISKSILEFLAFRVRLIDEKEIRDHKNYFWPKAVKEMLIFAGFDAKKIKTRFFEFYLNSFIIAEK